MASDPVRSRGSRARGANPEDVKERHALLMDDKVSSTGVQSVTGTMTDSTASLAKGEDAHILRSGEDEEKGECARYCAPESNPVKVIVKIGSCMIAGVVFGLALEKSRVFAPATIRGQMVFQRWIMLKMFLAAMGTGQLVMAVLSILPGAKNFMRDAMDAFTGCFANKGILTSMLGTFILGIGMTLSGACPGMVLAQVGSWTKNSIYTLIGALSGALLYGLFAPLLIRLTRPKNPLKVHTVHESLRWPYAALAIPMSVLILLAVFLMEWFIPWQDDLSLEDRNPTNTTSIFTLKSWPPAVGGVLVGVLQLVIIFAVGDTLGGSSSYMTLVSQWVVGKPLQRIFPHLAKFRCGIANWWQFFYVLSAMLGGFLSALSSSSVATAKGVSVPSAVCGGILLLFGARFAAGCTSGHGLSGAGLLYWLSLIGIPCMFVGGIATAFVMQATGALDDYHCYEDMLCLKTGQ